MAERILIAALIIALGIAFYAAWTRAQLWRRRSAVLGLESREPGKPAILYFTTPDCVPCRTQQIPALEVLLDETRSAVQIIRIDATLQPKIADHWGVLSAPTTFIIDHTGQPRRVNHGVALFPKLRGQLMEIGEWKGEFGGELARGDRSEPSELGAFETE